MKSSGGTGGAMQAGGAVVQGVGSILGGIAAKRAGKYTRKVMRVNAQNALRDGAMEGDRIRTAARMAMGRQLVDQGSSGFQMGSGSALDALMESATERELDLATVRRSAEMKAGDFRIQGNMAAQQGKAAFAGGIISGAASFLDAASQAFGGGA